MNERIFREYDIRGVVDKDFDGGFAFKLGKAYASLLFGEFGSDRPLTIAVGRDCRLSGEALTSRLVDGLVESGISVVLSGMGPTPQLYYTVFEKDLDGGIQVTGSHNPGDQNGFKMMLGKATLHGSQIQELRKYIVEDSYRNTGAHGSVEEFDARTSYIETLISKSKAHTNLGRGLKVVTDAGNGVGGLVGPDVLRGLGCEVIELFSEPDGSFPNHHPDPTVIENLVMLQDKVREVGADLGIAWDGDADRIGVVDEHGTPIFGDMLLLIYGRQLADELANPVIIGDVKCSEILFSELKRAGATPVMWKTGHSLIKSKLKEIDGHLAGEMSGHIFFSHRFYGFDDALHASARLIEILSNTDKSMSACLSDIPKSVSTPEIRMDCEEEVKFHIVERAKTLFPEYASNTLDGIRIKFDNGWGLVRASNTQSVLVMRFEADTEERLQEYRSIVETRISGLVDEIVPGS